MTGLGNSLRQNSVLWQWNSRSQEVYDPLPHHFPHILFQIVVWKRTPPWVWVLQPLVHSGGCCLERFSWYSSTEEVCHWVLKSLYLALFQFVLSAPHFRLGCGTIAVGHWQGCYLMMGACDTAKCLYHKAVRTVNIHREQWDSIVLLKARAPFSGPHTLKIR